MNEIFDLKGAGPELTTMAGFLKEDPENLSLLSDAVALANSEKQPEIARGLLSRFARLSSRSAADKGVIGLLALTSGAFEDAVLIFKNLIANNAGDSSLLFNLAWSLSMLGKHEEALEYLTLDAPQTLPQAAMLQVQLLHQLGKFETAIEAALKNLALHPTDSGLNAAISVLAMDVEDKNLARQCAERAGKHPDALTTLGVIALGESNAQAAETLFDEAMKINPHGPRTWIGKGLAQLSSGNPEAAQNIDCGAEMFGTHLGSWIAAGWAHYIRGDSLAARARFERALKIDDTFAEIHGSLAVLDVMDGEIEVARQRTKTALRLDNACFSAALAHTLLTSAKGDKAAAKRIFDRAINTPLDAEGRNLAEALAKISFFS